MAQGLEGVTAGTVSDCRAHQVPIIAIVSQVPALVDREVWDAAHAQLRANMTRRPSTRFNLLRGKVRCMLCGGGFVVASRSQNMIYYRCFRQLARQGRRCPASSLRAEPLEALAWEMCKEI
jgi:Recombinase zinc beta ribbon domain